MVLDVTIGGHTFKLVLNPNDDTTSKFSIDYNPSNDINANPIDVLVNLTDFSGTLYIRKARSDSNELIGGSKRSMRTNIGHVGELSSTGPGEIKESKALVATSHLQSHQSPEKLDCNENEKALQGTAKISNRDGNSESNSIDSDMQSRKDYTRSSIEIDASHGNISDSGFQSFIRDINAFDPNPSFQRVIHSDDLQKGNKTSFLEDQGQIIPNFHKSFENQLNDSQIFPNNDQTLESEFLDKSKTTDNYSFLDDEEDDSYNSLYKTMKRIAENKRNYRSTRLHTLCSFEDVSIKELYRVLNSNPVYSTYQDNQGRLPLHIIVQNEVLFTRKQKAYCGFVKALIQAFPASIVVKDDLYQVPFIATISSWIQNCYKGSRIDDLKSSAIPENEKEPMIIPLDVKVTSVVEWSFIMLSDFIQGNFDFGSKKFSTNLMTTSLSSMMNTNDQIIENFCSIPNILKTVLLIEDDAVMHNVLEMPIFQRSLLNSRLVGDWFVPLLMSKTMFTRAIDFLEIISDLKVSKALNLRLKPHLVNQQEFNTMRTNMTQHISRLDGLLKSIYLLPEQHLSRACSTLVLQRILDQFMIRSSVIRKIIIEVALNILLVISCYDLIYTKEATPMNTPSPLIFLSCVYFLICNDVVFYILIKSRKVFVKRYFKFWNIVETLSTLFILFAMLVFFITGHLPKIRFIIITRALIWLRLFGCLRNINMHLATFVLALSEIFSNLPWFLIVLLFACLMFGDLMNVAFIANQVCVNVDYSDRNVEADYCSGDLSIGLVRTYSILIGDDPDSYLLGYPDITFFWVFFTFFAIVILLNVLIAIVTESYQQAFMEKSKLFGKVRVPLLARQEFFEQNMITVKRSWRIRIGYFLFVLGFELSFIHLIILTLSKKVESYVFVFIAICSCALIVNVAAILEVIEKFDLKNYFTIHRRFNSFVRVERWLEISMRKMSQHLFGVKSCDFTDVKSSEEFEGRIDYVLSQTKEAIELSEYHILSDLRKLEFRLEQKGLLT